MLIMNVCIRAGGQDSHENDAWKGGMERTHRRKGLTIRYLESIISEQYHSGVSARRPNTNERGCVSSSRCDCADAPAHSCR